MHRDLAFKLVSKDACVCDVCDFQCLTKNWAGFYEYSFVRYTGQELVQCVHLRCGGVSLVAKCRVNQAKSAIYAPHIRFFFFLTAVAALEDVKKIPYYEILIKCRLCCSARFGQGCSPASLHCCRVHETRKPVRPRCTHVRICMDTASSVATQKDRAYHTRVRIYTASSVVLPRAAPRYLHRIGNIHTK